MNRSLFAMAGLLLLGAAPEKGPPPPPFLQAEPAAPLDSPPRGTPPSPSNSASPTSRFTTANPPSLSRSPNSRFDNPSGFSAISATTLHRRSRARRRPGWQADRVRRARRVRAVAGDPLRRRDREGNGSPVRASFRREPHRLLAGRQTDLLRRPRCERARVDGRRSPHLGCRGENGIARHPRPPSARTANCLRPEASTGRFGFGRGDRPVGPRSFDRCYAVTRVGCDQPGRRDAGRRGREWQSPSVVHEVGPTARAGAMARRAGHRSRVEPRWPLVGFRRHRPHGATHRPRHEPARPHLSREHPDHDAGFQRRFPSPEHHATPTPRDVCGTREGLKIEQ